VIKPITVLKTAVLAVSMIVLTPVIHSLLGLVVSQEGSITGEPNVPLLMAVVSGQAILMVVVFHRVRDLIPTPGGWTKGLAFGAFFLASVQIPSVFGIVAFEPGHDWEWFTAGKIANYATLAGDTMVFLVVGTLLGLLFPSRVASHLGWTRSLALAMVAGLVVFPIALWGIMHLAFGLLPLDDPNAPVGRSLWFNLVFYGVFFLTGACLPILHVVARKGRGLRSVGRSVGLFGLLWLPVQNFMVVFGWEVGGALFFSTLSMVPVALVVWVTDRIVAEPRRISCDDPRP
jgi:hypothetical protein